MNKINITKQDLVKSMTDDLKHRLALECSLRNISIDELLDNVIKLVDIYFESPAGKDYLEKRKEIEKIGMEMR